MPCPYLVRLFKYLKEVDNRQQCLFGRHQVVYARRRADESNAVRFMIDYSNELEANRAEE
jgi:hypothetical protein